MDKEAFFRQYAGRYRLVKIVIGGNDCSEAYENGWKDKSLYMFFEITAEGQFFMKAHAGLAEKKYEYFLDPAEMKYHLKEDYSDEGILISIREGVITEETKDHLMIYELTDELDESNPAI